MTDPRFDIGAEIVSAGAILHCLEVDCAARLTYMFVCAYKVQVHLQCTTSFLCIIHAYSSTTIHHSKET